MASDENKDLVSFIDTISKITNPQLSRLRKYYLNYVVKQNKQNGDFAPGTQQYAKPKINLDKIQDSVTITIAENEKTLNVDSSIKPIENKPVKIIRASKSVSVMPVAPVLPVNAVKPVVRQTKASPLPISKP